MVAQIEDAVLDAGLNATLSLATHIWVCATEPTTLSEIEAALIGFSAGAPGSLFGPPSPGTSPSGRRVTSFPVTYGTITTSGTASWWAVGTTAALLAHGLLGTPGFAPAGNRFALGSFSITVPNS